MGEGRRPGHLREGRKSVAMGQEEGSQVTLRVTDQSLQAPHGPGQTGQNRQTAGWGARGQEMSLVAREKLSTGHWSERGWGQRVMLGEVPRPLISLGGTGETGLCPSDTEGGLRLHVQPGVHWAKLLYPLVI